jgi:hypothetical protein
VKARGGSYRIVGAKGEVARALHDYVPNALANADTARATRPKLVPKPA